MLRVAWFSPLSPRSLTKSTLYSRQVLPLLPDDWEIELFADDQDLSELAADQDYLSTQFFGRPVFSYIHAYYRHLKQPFDVFLYHFEDDVKCNFIRSVSAIWPGVSIFHDLNLNHLYLSRLAHSTAETGLNQEMDRLFGPDSPRLGDWFVRGWSIDVFDSNYVRGASELEQASVAIVNQNIGFVVRKKFSKKQGLNFACTSCIQIENKHRSQALEGFRKQYLIPNNAKLIAYDGSLVLADRMQMIFEAFCKLENCLSANSNLQESYLVWLVQNREHEKMAKEFCENFFARNFDKYLFQNKVIIVSLNSIDEYLELLSQMDVFLALRFDEYRGLSLGAILALKLGLPTITTACSQIDGFPDDIILKIRPGRRESLELVSCIKELLVNEDLSQELKNKCLEFADTMLSPSLAAENLVEIVGENKSKIKSDILSKEKQISESKAGQIDHLNLLFAQCPDISRSACVDFGWQTQ